MACNDYIHLERLFDTTVPPRFPTSSAHSDANDKRYICRLTVLLDVVFKVFEFDIGALEFDVVFGYGQTTCQPRDSVDSSHLSPHYKLATYTCCVCNIVW
jgi:hypothetical protein